MPVISSPTDPARSPRSRLSSAGSRATLDHPLPAAGSTRRHATCKIGQGSGSEAFLVKRSRDAEPHGPTGRHGASPCSSRRISDGMNGCSAGGYGSILRPSGPSRDRVVWEDIDVQPFRPRGHACRGRAAHGRAGAHRARRHQRAIVALRLLRGAGGAAQRGDRPTGQRGRDRRHRGQPQAHGARAARRGADHHQHALPGLRGTGRVRRRADRVRAPVWPTASPPQPRDRAPGRGHRRDREPRRRPLRSRSAEARPPRPPPSR